LLSRPTAAARAFSHNQDPERKIGSQFCCAAQRGGATTSAGTQTGYSFRA
jgi:hypothetical protein